jgi:NAD(P)-dependent dehydrogenase (short-subunit alcohol dehydrogenase family)
MRLEGKVAIVTGGARNIGAVYSKRLAAEGARVVIADILDGVEVVKEIEKANGEALSLRVDVSKEEDTVQMAQQTVKRFGRIDILVNNAAIFLSINRRPFYELSAEEWDQVTSVNIKGPFLCAKAVFPQMKNQGSGKIINISSTTARHSPLPALRGLQGSAHRNDQVPGKGGRRIWNMRQCHCPWPGGARRTNRTQSVHRIPTEGSITQEAPNPG